MIFFVFLCAFLGAEQYQIRSVEYEIEGKTREYPLTQAVKIDTNRIFTSFQDIEDYLTYLQAQFQNQRVLESAFVTPTYGQPDAQNIIPVDLLINTKDSWSIVPAPAPRYSSSNGGGIKIKLKDYNFLGFMTELNAEIDYDYDIEDEANDHTIGGEISVDVPFKLGLFDMVWINKIGLSYTIGHKGPSAKFLTGLDIGYEINDVVYLAASVYQGITYDLDYEEYGDAFYLTEGAWFGIPITLARTDTVGNISWTPSIGVTYFWDPDGINTNNEDLIDTQINISHAFSFGRVDWIGNFREGFSFSIRQAFSQETYSNRFSTAVGLDAEYFKAFKYAGFNSRLHIFKINNDTNDDVGKKIRGIRNNLIDTDSALVINFDLPIKIWQTDWVGYGLWNWTELFNFELQISPFIDIAIGNNLMADSKYSLKDGWYGAGIEILGFLNKARSVVGRISFGVDVVQFAEKIGNRIDFVDRAVNKLFNTSWRKGSWYEFEFGVGLFY